MQKISKRQQAELKLRKLLKAQLIIENGGVCDECGNCGGWRGLELSHEIPLSRGGKTERSNVKILCAPCHAVKKHHLREAL